MSGRCVFQFKPRTPPPRLTATRTHLRVILLDSCAKVWVQKDGVFGNILLATPTSPPRLPCIKRTSRHRYQCRICSLLNVSWIYFRIEIRPAAKENVTKKYCRAKSYCKPCGKFRNDRKHRYSMCRQPLHRCTARLYKCSYPHALFGGR